MASNLPSTVVIAAETPGEPAQRPARARPDQTFQAQVLGQGGAKRGLRGGQPVLDAARSAYLATEWRGPDDRRIATGALKRVVL